MGSRGASKSLAFGMILALIAAAGTARAASPFGRLFDTGRVNADPQKPYPLQESNGPWLIVACSFAGPDAEKQAHDLVLELRQRYNFEAFVHKKEFKLDDPNGGREVNPLDPAAVRWKYKKFNRSTAEIDEVAVLVGNYRSIDDPAAHETLKTLKFAQPDCLKVEDGKPTSRTLAVMRTFQEDIKEKCFPGESSKKPRGPMGHAFITTNPMLPPDYYAPKNGIDELELRMNKEVTHSLLDCPGKYTVQVAHFMGKVTIDQREIQRIEARRGGGKQRFGQGGGEGAPTDRGLAVQGLGGVRVPRPLREHCHDRQLRFGGHAARRRQDRDQSADSQDYRVLSREANEASRQPRRPVDGANAHRHRLRHPAHSRGSPQALAQPRVGPRIVIWFPAPPRKSQGTLILTDLR